MAHSFDLRQRVARMGPFGRTLGIITGIGWLLRVGYILAVKRGIDTCGTELCGDAFYYSSSANVFAHGNGFENRLGGPGTFTAAADHPPLTTIVMAPTNLFFLRHSVLAQRLGMALLGALAIVLIGLLARRLAGDHAGLIAAGIAVINPNFWMNDVVVMSETVGTVAIIVILLTVYRFIDEPTWRRAAWIGVACGVAALSRAELLLFVPIAVVPVALMVREISWPARLGRIAVAGGFAVLMLAPWTLYNVGRFDKPVLLSTNDGITLLGANCDEVYGVNDPGGIGFWNLGCTWAYADKMPAGADQSVVSSIYRDAGINYIRTHKSLLPKVIAIRLGRGWGFFGPDQMAWLNQGEGRERWASFAGYAMWWVMLVPAAAGAVVLRRRGVPIWPLLSTVVIVSITLTVFYGIVRFRLPADVAVVVLAAAAFDALIARRRSQVDAAEPSGVHERTETPLAASAT